MEVNHDPRNYPPEIPHGTAPERAYEQLQPGSSATEKENRFSQRRIKSLPRKLSRKRKWTLAIMAIIIFIIILAGTIGGTHGSKRRLVLLISVRVTILILFRAVAPPKPSVPSVDDYSQQRLLANSSIAATTCPNGDRWIFVQGAEGSIHAATFLGFMNHWNASFDDYYNLTTARMGSPLSASCAEIGGDINYPPIQPGQYVRSIYSCRYT